MSNLSAAHYSLILILLARFLDNVVCEFKKEADGTHINEMKLENWAMHAN
jgi:hypothetical protein